MASRKVNIGEFINNVAVTFNLDGEILPLIFPGSRIPIRFDKALSFWNAPPECGPASVVYSVGVSAEGGRTRQDVNSTGCSQRKFKGQDETNE